MNLDTRRIALQGITAGLIARDIAVQGFDPLAHVVLDGQAEKLRYLFVGRSPKARKRARSDEALMLGRLYLS